MQKGSFRLEKSKEIYLHSTEVSNLFIGEMLPSASGDYIKVYLFGLMNAQHGIDVSIDQMARYLGLSVSEVKEAFDYWAHNGAVKLYQDPDDPSSYGVEYLRMVDKLYGHKTESDEEKPKEETKVVSIDDMSADDRIAKLIDNSIRMLFVEIEEATGRLLSSKEMNKIKDGVKVLNIPYDVFSYAIKYCKENEKYSVDYICKVAANWSQNGCSTVEDVKAYLDKFSKRQAMYGAVFKEIGFNRMPTPADKEMMDTWIDDWGYKISDILDACRKTVGQREPSLNYVNAVLRNKMQEKGGINTSIKNTYQNYQKVVNKQGDGDAAAPTPKVSKQVLTEYLEYLRRTSEREQKERIDELRKKIPDLNEVFEEEAKLSRMVKLAMTDGSTREKRKELRRKLKENSQMKLIVLTNNGYDEDYLERKYKCNLCKDNGVTDDGVICSCCHRRAEEAYKWKIERNKN